MSNIEPEADETSEAGTAEVSEAQSADDTSGLIMAEVADEVMVERLDERESQIGERKEMGPPLEFDDASLENMPSADSSESSESQEVTPTALAQDE